jgi:hypothetical protein
MYCHRCVGERDYPSTDGVQHHEQELTRGTFRFNNSTYVKLTHNKSPERKHLARFACVVVPLIWLRDIFIIYDIVLIYIDTSEWSKSASLATTFLLMIFGQFANLAILATILWGAWRMGKTVPVFDRSSSD